MKYYDCDLKKYSTDYSASQQKYEGTYKKFKVDFRHPFIEIDNNKCILCARCVRICKEVVGANALGLVKRGFETYVAPSLGNQLCDTDCESCGMCISACPTAAMSENVPFKPGPVETIPVDSVCNYCSVGCEITYHKKGNFIWRVTGKEGMVNKEGNICRYARFGYQYMNDTSRITKPLLKENGKFKEISFEDAFRLIAEKCNSKNAQETALFAGARLSNEELFLLKKIAEKGIQTKNISSFHYLGRGLGYNENSSFNTTFDQIKGAEKIFILGSEANKDNAVAGFMIYNEHYLKNVPLIQITTIADSAMNKKVNDTIKIKSYYHFVKAANHYLIAEEKQNSAFINSNIKGFEEYKKAVLSESFEALVAKSGVSADIIKAFADDYNNTSNAILVFAEKNVSANASFEIKNLAIITGKLGKTSMGIISLKEKNNSEGLVNSGIISNNNMLLELESGKIKNLLIFGEDPIGCALDKKKISGIIEKADFILVQDYFMSETAKAATLILPASFPVETGGSFTNTQRVIQNFGKEIISPLEKCSISQLKNILEKFNIKSTEDINAEMLADIATNKTSEILMNFTSDDNDSRMFEHGCDSLTLRFNAYFERLNEKK